MSNEAQTHDVAAKAKRAKAKPQFECKLDQALLKRALPIIKKVTGSRSTNPITRHVRIRAQAGVCTITATDLEVGFETPIGIADGEGDAVISPEMLKDVAALCCDGQKLVLSSKSERHVEGMDPEEYPKVFGDERSDYLCAVDMHGDLVEAIEATVPCVAIEKGRYALNGVLFELHKDRVELCGTDGRRLAYRSIDCRGLAEKPELSESFDKGGPKYQVIVPRKALDLVSRFTDGPVSFSFTENVIQFRSGASRLRSLLVEGQFPDYRSVIPKSLDGYVIVEREEFVRQMKLAQEGTSIESQAARLEIDKEGLRWRTKCASKGQATGLLQLQETPLPITIGFDPIYLIQGAESFNGKWLAIEYRDKETGAILHDGRKDRAYYLCMPIDI